MDLELFPQQAGVGGIASDGMGSPRALGVPDPAKVRGQALGTWALALAQNQHTLCLLHFLYGHKWTGGWARWCVCRWVDKMDDERVGGWMAEGRMGGWMNRCMNVYKLDARVTTV